MFGTILSKAKTWATGGTDDSNGLAALDREEVEKRIHELERSREEHHEELDALRDRYRSSVDRASTVDEFKLEVVRKELSFVLRRTALARAKVLKATKSLQLLQKLALAKQSDRSFPGFDIDVADLPTVIRDSGELKSRGDLHLPRVLPDSSSAADELSPWLENQLGDVEACVDAVVTAAQSNEPVPTLTELLENDEKNTLAVDSCDTQLVTAGSDDGWVED